MVDASFQLRTSSEVAELLNSNSYNQKLWIQAKFKSERQMRRDSDGDLNRTGPSAGYRMQPIADVDVQMKKERKSRERQHNCRRWKYQTITFLLCASKLYMTSCLQGSMTLFMINFNTN